MPILMAANFSRYQLTRCHRLGWTLERIGWGFMAATMLAAVVGVFGDGWLSAAETRGPGASRRSLSAFRPSAFAARARSRVDRWGT